MMEKYVSQSSTPDNQTSLLIYALAEPLVTGSHNRDLFRKGISMASPPDLSVKVDSQAFQFVQSHLSASILDNTLVSPALRDFEHSPQRIVWAIAKWSRSEFRGVGRIRRSETIAWCRACLAEIVGLSTGDHSARVLGTGAADQT